MGMQLRCKCLIIQPFILRRLKTDLEIIQTCQKNWNGSICSLSTEQAELYQRVVEVSGLKLNQLKDCSVKDVLALLVKLKQILTTQPNISSKPHWGLLSLQASSAAFRMLEALSEGDLRALISSICTGGVSC